MKKHIFLSLILVLICASPFYAQKRGMSEYPELRSGESVDGVIRTGSNSWYETYQIRITPRMTGIRLKLSNAPADLDLYFRYGAPMDDYSQADAYSETERYNEELSLYRYDDSGMENGYAYIDVAYMFDSRPQEGQQILEDIPFTLSYEAVFYELQEELSPGDAQAGALEPEKFMIQTFPVAIPSDAEVLRIDLLDATGDLDVMVSTIPVISSEDYPLIKADSVVGNESVLVQLERKYRGETLFVTVMDPIASDRKQTYRIIAGFSEEPQWEVPALPEFDLQSSSRDRALQATVELISPSGGGSGTIVSPKGLILTNYHVIENKTGGVHDRVVVARVEDLYRPTRETFYARVLESSEILDCALLQVESGYYGQPLPRDYQFPWYRTARAEDLSLGDEIRILGFPVIGGSGSRATVNLSRGILSGGERVEDLLVLKTDAKISSGNSGGAATDERFRLIGIPSFVIEEGGENIGYIIPLSSLPDDWVSRYFPSGLFTP